MYVQEKRWFGVSKEEKKIGKVSLCFPKKFGLSVICLCLCCRKLGDSRGGTLRPPWHENPNFLGPSSGAVLALSSAAAKVLGSSEEAKAVLG